MTKIEMMMDEYQEVTEWANKDLSDWPGKTRPGAEMRKRESQTRLAEIEDQYSKQLRDTALVIVPTGTPENVELFTMATVEAAGALVVDAQGLYNRLADAVEPSVGDRGTFGTTQLQVLIAAMEEACRELNLRDVQIPLLEDLVHCKSREELLSCIRFLVIKVNGISLTKAAIEADVLKSALRIRYNRSALPVVVVNVRENDLSAGLPKALFNGNGFVVPVTKENVTQEQVAKTLLDIKENLSKKKSKATTN